VCHDPYLGYPERYLRVALEICRIDVLFVTAVLALAHSCIACKDCCRMGVLSIVFSALVTVVLDSACSS